MNTIDCTFNTVQELDDLLARIPVNKDVVVTKGFWLGSHTMTTGRIHRIHRHSTWTASLLWMNAGYMEYLWLVPRFDVNGSIKDPVSSIVELQ